MSHGFTLAFSADGSASTAHMTENETQPSLHVYLRNPDGSAFDLRGAQLFELHVSGFRPATLFPDEVNEAEGHRVLNWTTAGNNASPTVPGVYEISGIVKTAQGDTVTFTGGWLTVHPKV